MNVNSLKARSLILYHLPFILKVYSCQFLHEIRLHSLLNQHQLAAQRPPPKVASVPWSTNIWDQQILTPLKDTDFSVQSAAHFRSEEAQTESMHSNCMGEEHNEDYTPHATVLWPET